MTTYVNTLTNIQNWVEVIEVVHPRVDPRMTAYMQARARHVATWGDGNMDTWEEAQFAGPTGIMRED